MGKVLIVKGCSGSGKSTRVEALIKSLGEPNTILDWGFIIGNTLVIGRSTKKNGKFQGLDGAFKKIGSMINFSEFITEYSKSYNIIVEGSALALSHRLRPKFLEYQCGVKESLCVYYIYNTKEEYLQRIFDRTGSYPKKDTGWSHNDHFIKEYNKMYLPELDLVQGNHTAIIDKFDSPISNFLDVSLEFLFNK